jgi:hypothetical protein
VKNLRPWALLIPAVAFLGLHLRTVDYGFVWTDETEIVAQGIVLPIASLHRAFWQPRVGDLETGRAWAYYRPLQVVLVSAIHSAFGELPRAYRLPSLFLGALTSAAFAGLVWAWQARLGAALFAGLLPALHPAALEIYVWIAGLSAALSDLFVVAGFACGFLWLRASSLPRLAGCVACSLLALASKETGVILPVLLLAQLAGERLSGRPVPRRGLALVGTLGGLAALHVAVLRPAVLGGSASIVPIEGSRLTHVLTALASWPSSLGWMAFPSASSTSDVVEVVSSAASPAPWLGLGLALASFAAWLWLARRGFAMAALGIAWVWIAFLPAANLLPTLHARAERHVYLSTFGLALVLADLAPALFARLRAPAVVLPLVACLFLGALSARSFGRAPAWRSTQTLFDGDVARDPDYREGRYWLAGALLRERRPAEALRHLEVLLTQIPKVAGKASYLGGDPRILYCNAKLDLRDYAGARRFAEDLARERPGAGSRPGIRRCLAAALEGSEDYAGAVAIYEEVAWATERPDAWLLLAAARCNAHLGRNARARTWLGRIPAQSDPAVSQAALRIGERIQAR